VSDWANVFLGVIAPFRRGNCWLAGATRDIEQAHARTQRQYFQHPLSCRRGRFDETIVVFAPA